MFLTALPKAWDANLLRTDRCTRNQLTLFVSSLCAQTPERQAHHWRSAWRPAAQDASEASFRKSIDVERELTSKKLDFVKVDLAQTEEQAIRRLRRLSVPALKASIAEFQHVDADRKRINQVYRALRNATTPGAGKNVFFAPLFPTDLPRQARDKHRGIVV